MRVNKYRGKRLDKGQWIFGSLIIDNVTGKYFIAISVNESSKVGEDGCLYVVSCEVEPSTVGQFTGVYDSDNKPIYENDLVQVTNFLVENIPSYKAEVVWDKWRFALRNIDKELVNNTFMFPYVNLDPFGISLKVIENHDQM